MLGAVDSMLEREGDEEEPLPQLASWRSPVLQKLGWLKLTGIPFEAAVKLFEERQILPKPQFDALRDAAKRKAFTVAGLATEELIGDAHAELARQIRESKEKTYYDEASGKWVYKGPNLREFDKFARDRLETAGWTPANPSHVETVFRTNVMGAYGSGRIIETTQPAVVAARPYWQIVGVNDSRQRPTHRKAHGTILSADHPFWRRAYPPFGYNCRCRVVSRSKRWVDAHGGPTLVPDGLPDPGFASGIDASLVPNLQVDTEGQRQPQPAKAPHPIDREPPARPTVIAPPAMPVVQPVAPTLPVTPIAPAPIVDPTSFEAFGEAGVKVRAESFANVQHTARKFFGENLTPKRVKTMLATDGLLQGSQVEYKVLSGGDEIWFTANIIDDAGETAANIVRSYKVSPGGEKIVHHELVKFAEKYQGQKLGPELIRRQVREYLALGVDKVETEAAWVGQYYWPSIGFQLRDPDDLIALKDEFRKYLVSSGVKAKRAAEIAARPKTVHELSKARSGGRKVGKDFLLQRGESDAPLLELQLDLAEGSADRRILTRRIGL